jgi:tetratricopeptide (TPR) repeat protein
MGAIRAGSIIFLLATAATSCSKDPAVAKRDFVASGDSYMATKKYDEAIIQYRNAVKLDPKFGEARLKLADALTASDNGKGALAEYVRAADLLPTNPTAQLRAGQLLLMARQYPEAKARAEKILDINPKSVDGLLLMANALAGLKDFDSAIEQVESAINEDPNQPLNYANLALIENAKGNKAAAENAFKRAVEVDPNSPSPHWSLGNFYWASGRIADAENELKAAYKISPKSPVILRGLAAFYISTGRTIEAETYLKAYAEGGDVLAKLALADFYTRVGRPADARTVLTPLSSDPTALVRANTRLAAIEYDGGNHQKAYQLIDAALQRDSKDEAAVLAKFNFLLTDKKPAEALVLANSVVDANPKSTRGLYAKAAALRALGRRNDAETALEELLALRPRDVPSQVMLAEVYLEQGKTAQAAELSAQAIKSQPNAWMPHFVSARVAVAQRNYPRAESELDLLVKATPSAMDVHILRGDMYLQRRDIARARQAYEHALSLDKRHKGALLGLIRSDLGEKKFDSARSRAMTLLETDSDDPIALNLAGATFADSGDKALAEATFRKAIEKHTANLDAYLALGRLYLSEKRLDEARKEFEEVAKRQPERAVSAHTIVGMILAMQGKRDEARKSFQQAIAINPDAASVAANNLAWDYAENGGNLDEALQLAQRAKTQMPQNSSVTDTLGWIYYKKGLTSLAVSTLQEAAVQDATNPAIRYRLGLAYIADGKVPEAQRALNEALRLNPQFSFAENAKRLLASLRS